MPCSASATRPTIMGICERIRRLSSAPGPYITILPANPAFIVVPYYNPLIVFAPPRPGFFIGGAIGFRFGVGDWPGICPLGLGRESVCVGRAPRVHQ